MSSASLKLMPWGTLRYFTVIILAFLVLNQFTFGDSCFIRQPSRTYSKRLIRHNSKNVPFRNAKAEDSLRSSEQTTSSSPPSPFPLDVKFVSKLFKFVKNNLLTEKLTTDAIIKRLNNLKENLVTHYAKQTLLEHLPGLSSASSTSVSTARDKKIGFPSLEGALLSLAFLTFSVLLIDMIQTLLAKLKLRAPAVTVAPAIIGRRFYDGKSGPPWKLENTLKETITALSSQVLSAIENPWPRLR